MVVEFLSISWKDKLSLFKNNYYSGFSCLTNTLITHSSFYSFHLFLRTEGAGVKQ